MDGAAELRLEIDLRPLGPLQLEVGLGYAVRDRTEAWAHFVPKPWQQVAWRHGPLASLTFTLAQRIYVTGSIARWWQPACQVSRRQRRLPRRRIRLPGLRTDRDHALAAPPERRMGSLW